LVDFFTIQVKESKNGTLEITPDFIVGRSKDLMVKGKAFHAIWDEAQGLWSTDEYDVQRLVDDELRAHVEGLQERTQAPMVVKYLRSSSSGSWYNFRKFVSLLSDSTHELDSCLTFSNTEVKKSDYVSKRLPYPLEAGDTSAWEEIVGTLYSVEERAKIEWAIGAVVSGDSKRIQKFLTFYGPAGTGKSTILNIIQKLFEGYVTTFDAKALGSSNGSFATAAFKDNPLVAIQHDGDLSKIQDNTKLNSIIAHEDMEMNEKYKPGYTARVNAFIFMGTNQPVKITDAKSGLIRRLIDVHPTGVKIPANHYHALMARIDFELGAIAARCLEVYREMGKNYYNNYRPLEMMLQTDVFFNFVEYNYDRFKEKDATTLSQAYALYKEFCNETGIERLLPQYKFREELRNYFKEFHDRGHLDGNAVRSLYRGFSAHPFKAPAQGEAAYSLVMEESTSLFDEWFADQPAQGAKEDETPLKRWATVKTTLKDIDTSQVHYVQVPEHHIVIDFDLKDENGEKSLERNLEAASSWPATYGELSKGGQGVHLHYNYDGSVEELAAHYSDGIEVKTLLGDASLRRKLSKCNNVPVATLTSGLPLKEKKVYNAQEIASEAGLRNLIGRNLRKEIHPSTKSSVEFIKKILDEFHASGKPYDVSDLKPKIIAFANASTNQAPLSLKMVTQMKWKSEEIATDAQPVAETEETSIALFDLEVYPNLFTVGWKYEDAPKESTVVMINPSPADIEAMLKKKLVGFNNRRYDNHILYAALQGYNNEQLFNLSQKIIVDRNVGAMFGSAYGLSYADIYDFSSKKQSLKKFQIDLGLHHMELDLPWDQPVAEEDIPRVVEYMVNDIVSTEAAFKDRKQDFVARQILADLSGLPVNDTTAKHTAKIIFGSDRNPQASFVYTDLAKEFPGYEYHLGKSAYRGKDPSEGGYVFGNPGIWFDVAVLDVASMHPTSIEQLNLFGPYTKNFSALKAARLAIKRGDYESARQMLNGKLAPHLHDESQAAALSYALKIVINIVYGLTSAKFDNPFRDVRNKDNIVAKRGALFMIDLQLACEEKGLEVVHIKTDSIKIANATQEDIEEIINFGEKYGYEFEHEVTYDKFCLVNDAVYIAKKGDKWDAVGAQFQHPYVYKTLFSGEKIELDDLCETKQVTQGAMYLDFEHDRPAALSHDGTEGMQFIGRTGRFIPVLEGSGGGVLYRVKDDKKYAVAGTKGYLWVEAEMFRNLDVADINMSYFEGLLEDAQKTINKFGDFDEFVA
jgi:hypothetical protein